MVFLHKLHKSYINNLKKDKKKTLSVTLTNCQRSKSASQTRDWLSRFLISLSSPRYDNIGQSARMSLVVCFGFPQIQLGSSVWFHLNIIHCIFHDRFVDDSNFAVFYEKENILCRCVAVTFVDYYSHETFCTAVLWFCL